jgi:putative hemolysin
MLPISYAGNFMLHANSAARQPPGADSAHPAFRLNGAFSLPRLPRLSRLIERGVERALGLDELQRRYSSLPPTRDVDGFLDEVLRALRIGCDLPPGQLDRIPRSGPAIVVANHPFGAIEGVVLARLLRRVRPDVRIVANHLLARIPELAELFVPVDVFGGKRAARANARPLRGAVRWVQQGGLLLVFPAGAVSRLRLHSGRVVDPSWSPSIGRMVALTRAPVLPVFIHGRNSALFQTAGLLHQLVRTALLPREFLNKAGSTLRLRIGLPIPHTHLEGCRSDSEIVRYLRLRTYVLAGLDPAAPPDPEPDAATGPGAIAPAIAPDVLGAEVAALPADQRLLASGRLSVHWARASQIPWCLQEIGRLRELAFRAAGEGTGKASDIDLFDAYYRHLFLWDGAAREIVGAYRLGYTDEILAHYGKRGLYTHSLFRYGRQVLERVNPGIELGRSFVRPEHQRSFAPLLLLWRGIGMLVARAPRYAVLFGPVSISASYAPLSRQLLVDFLRTTRSEPSLARHVKPRRPFRTRRSPAADEVDVARLRDIEDVARLVAEIERDRKGVPILLRQYLKLGGRLLGFSCDENFSHALDGLIMVDLRSTDAGVLARYMGDDGASAFLAYHTARPDAASGAARRS